VLRVHESNSPAAQRLLDAALPLVPPRLISQTLLKPYLSEVRCGGQVENQLRLIHFKKVLRRHGVLVAPGGNDKLLDYEFAGQVGIDTARTLQSGVSVRELDLSVECAIKPLQGAAARNVFLLYGGGIYEAKGGAEVSSRMELLDICDRRGVGEKRWISEQLILRNGRPSHDFKVYAYYGKVGAVLEIRRSRKVEYCWYWPDGSLIDSMMGGHNTFRGCGFSGALIRVAERVSLNTPTPFLRVDCFGDDAGKYYLGEITPHPGRYAGGYSCELDSKLGQEFFDAEARLFADLLRGKAFKVYRRVYKRSIRASS